MDDPFGISKAEKKKNGPSGAAIAGGGATVGGVGWLAGGRPKSEADVSRIKFTSDDPKDFLPNQAKVANQMRRTGILGFRTKMHQGGLYGFKQDKTAEQWKGSPKTSSAAFDLGRASGKIEPEVKVLRHMSGGRKAAHGALATGAVTAAVGAKKHKDEMSKRSDAQNDALEGAGFTGLGLAGAGSAVLSSQRRKWAKVNNKSIDAAGKLAPRTAGRRKSKITGKPGMSPSVTDGAIVRNNLLDNVTLKNAEKVGELRGTATQARHFAHAYGNTGKGTAIGGGAASIAAISSARKDRERNVSKSTTLTNNDIKRKKATQSRVAQTTGALALGGLGAFTASKLPNSTRAVKLVPQLKKINQKKAENTALGLSTTSGGIGGVGSFNFAQYTKAEAEKGKVRKSYSSSPFGVVHD